MLNEKNKSLSWALCPIGNINKSIAAVIKRAHDNNGIVLSLLFLL